MSAAPGTELGTVLGVVGVLPLGVLPALLGADALGVGVPGLATLGVEFPRRPITVPAPAAAARTATISIGRTRPPGLRGGGGGGGGP